MDEAKKKALLGLARQARQSEDRDTLRKMMSMYQTAMGRDKFTGETGAQLLEASADPSAVTRVPGSKEVLTEGRELVPGKASKDMLGEVTKIKGKNPKKAIESLTKVPGKGAREVIDTMSKQDIISADDFVKKIAKSRALKKFAKTGLKSVPLVGPLASALMSGDVSAAVPIINEADELGPKKGSPSSVLEDPKASPEARRAAIMALRKASRGEK